MIERDDNGAGPPIYRKIICLTGKSRDHIA